MDWPEMKPLITVDDLARENATLRKRVEELEELKSEPSCMEAEHGGHPTCLHTEEAMAALRVRAEKAERERDEARADLDAALDWIEHDEEESIPPAGLWQRVKALLETRRKRG